MKKAKCIRVSDGGGVEGGTQLCVCVRVLGIGQVFDRCMSSVLRCEITFSSEKEDASHWQKGRRSD